MLASSRKIYLLEGVEIDASRVVVRKSGTDCSLRPKTFYLLIYLIENRDRLVPKEELIQQVWPDTAVSDGALARCVAEIRAILGEDPRNPRFIRTAARLGYQFIGSVEVGRRRSTAAEETTAAPLEDAEPVRLITMPVALPPASRERRTRPLLFLRALAGLGITAAFAAWNKWGQPAPAAKEPEWWETAWWKLNEGSGPKISDSIHGLTAPLPAGTSWIAGISGPALLFAGREIVHGNDPNWLLPSGAAARTLMAWVKANATQGDMAPIFGEGDAQIESAPGSGFSLVLHESGAGAFMTDHFPLAGTTRIDDGRWHQLTGVFDGGVSRRIHLFVDGVEEGAKQLAYPITGNKVSRWFI